MILVRPDAFTGRHQPPGNYGPSRDEQVEAFKCKMGVTPRDHLIVITFG
jgi:hypothetical protein